MKICPQCQSAYADDYLFCLTDGNTLRDESGEQETILVNRIVLSDMHQAEVPGLTVACLGCGLINRANSKFCKKCGVSITGRPQSVIGEPHRIQSMPSPTALREAVVFLPQKFTPPNSLAGAPNSRSSGGRHTLLGSILGSILVLAIIVVGFVIYNLKAGEKSTNKIANNTVNADRTVQTNPDIGRKGRLLTNQRIRSAPNLNGEILGVHYKGALIKVLEVSSYSTEEGYMTWYRVQVLENGCDTEGIRGCGNDLFDSPGMAAMEGWTSAKNIALN